MTGEPTSSQLWPIKIKLHEQHHTLDVTFSDGATFTYTAEYLRVESPCQDLPSHGMSQKKIIPGCRNVKIKSVEPVSTYALRIRFDDNHNTGIYSWDYLHDLGTKKQEKWQRYLEILASLGLNR